jgi:LCP family protein required for cell wall assembly
MNPQPAISMVNGPQRKRHWSRRKKIAVWLVAFMILTPFLTAGIYVWNITRAIEGAQDQAVVSLPTSLTQLGGVSQSLVGDQAADGTPVSINDGTVVHVIEDIEPTETAGSELPPTGQTNPSAVGIARDLIGTGTRADIVHPNEAWPEKKHINVLVLGVDTRDADGDQNADVIMIARVDFIANEVRLVSIPRDLEVTVPGFGLHKINGAYNIGVQEDPVSRIAGVLMMRDTIEYNFGVPIDEFVLVDFDGFEEVIDAVGGITINVPERIEDEAYPTEDFGTTTLIIEEGMQHMDGDTALAYARTRHQDSDDQRRDRQMLVLRALLDKGQSLGSVTRITQVVRATGGAVITSIGWDKQLALVGVGLKLDQRDIVMENIMEPLVTPGTSEIGQWIYVGDPVEIGQFIEQVLSGRSAPD